MNYSVFIADEAIEDIFELVRYIHKELCNPDAAENLYQELRNKINNLGDYPRKFASTEIQYRGYVIHKKVYKTYLIFYIIDDEEKSVYVIRVMKELMNWKNILRKRNVYHFKKWGGEFVSQIEQLQKLIDESKRIVFFGGAGVSTESGIPDFRSTDGLYHQQYAYPPETILSHTFFMRKTEEFYRFYRDKMLCLDAKPNAAHLKLAELEAAGKLTAVVTQNIDGLHQSAGSKKVLELHGSVLRNYCMRCGKFYEAENILHSEGIPKCECGGTIKPDVVLYEEGLDDQVMGEAIHHIANADMLIIGGTSLVVYPAAGMIRYFRGDKLVLLNKSATSADEHATLCIRDSIGQVLKQIKVK